VIHRSILSIPKFLTCNTTCNNSKTIHLDLLFITDDDEESSSDIEEASDEDKEESEEDSEQEGDPEKALTKQYQEEVEEDSSSEDEDNLDPDKKKLRKEKVMRTIKYFFISCANSYLDKYNMVQNINFVTEKSYGRYYRYNL
jgi:hypothetical protein